MKLNKQKDIKNKISINKLLINYFYPCMLVLLPGHVMALPPPLNVIFYGLAQQQGSGAPLLLFVGFEKQQQPVLHSGQLLCNRNNIFFFLNNNIFF